jgi:hypothetical protein
MFLLLLLLILGLILLLNHIHRAGILALISLDALITISYKFHFIKIAHRLSNNPHAISINIVILILIFRIKIIRLIEILLLLSISNNMMKLIPNQFHLLINTILTKIVRYFYIVTIKVVLHHAVYYQDASVIQQGLYVAVVG